MEENEQARGEISLSDIFILLLLKIKILILVVFAAVVVGASFGVLRTYDKKYYGTTIEFYVNPRLDRSSSTDTESQYGVYGAYGKHVMDNMVKLLSSELFAEQLMLALDENGDLTDLPEKIEGQTELNNLIDQANEEKEKHEKAIKQVEAAISELASAKSDLSTKNKKLEDLWAVYRNQNSSLTVTPSLGVADEVDAAITAVNIATQNVSQKNTSLQTKETLALKAEEDYLQTKEKLFKIWRSSYADYATELQSYLDDVSYSFYNTTETSNVDSLARSFIYVNISVLNNEEFAKEIYQKIVRILPEFVETNMAVPAGYDGTNCQQITRNDGIRLTNEDLVFKTSIKYALLLGAISFVVACAVIVVVDRADKRLKNVELVTQIFNIPLLGVIPSIKNEMLTDKEEKASSAEVKK